MGEKQQILMLEEELTDLVKTTLTALYGERISDIPINFQHTRKEFEGDRTLVVFPYLKFSGKSPEITAEEIGKELLGSSELIVDYNVVKGFLNLIVDNVFWVNWLRNFKGLEFEAEKGTYMVEYSSPNTNKPLHLGHVRNNLLGYSVSRILEATGKKVVKVQVINDRGIHICKSMLAWETFGKGVSPQSSGKKGDHLVGEFYVKFDQVYKEEVKALVDSGMEQKQAESNAPIMKSAKDMLLKWEEKDQKVRGTWKMMNDWVYEGFNKTYERLGVQFDRLYYESETYLVGKDEVIRGLGKGIFESENDGSVWVDLTEDGLDRKILIRSDGTSVYMTQDIGTAILRFKDYPDLEQLVYTVGNEQNYHFKVLFLILKKLGFSWAEGCVHLSYGMVELPSGKMKSREGTVVDADDLMDEMVETARLKSEELGKLEGFSESEKEALYHVIGMGALKYFILKVDPKKQMTFNPEESIDFAGNTGPFVQYTHARIKTLLAKSESTSLQLDSTIDIEAVERNLIKELYRYKEVLELSAREFNPAYLANYAYDLVKLYNQFYQTVPVLKEENTAKRNFRLLLSTRVAERIANAMSLLGIAVPDKM
ncbi:MAG: arginine--tRNA ligase [Vicingaceae bacterium]